VKKKDMLKQEKALRTAPHRKKAGNQKGGNGEQVWGNKKETNVKLSERKETVVGEKNAQSDQTGKKENDKQRGREKKLTHQRAEKQIQKSGKRA